MISMKHGEIYNLSIEKLGEHGEGIAFINDSKVFIDKTLPSEEVKIRLKVIKQNYAKGSLLSIEKKHEKRITPACSRYEECGGCQLMHVDYEEQLSIKTNFVKQAFLSESIDNVQILQCIPATKTFQYRNKMQLPVAKVKNEIIAGFYALQSHKIIPYEKCLIHHETIEKIALAIKSALQNANIEPYCEKSHQGTLRHFIVRANNEGQILLGLVTTGKQKFEISSFAKKILAREKNIIGVVENINTNKQNTILGQQTNLLAGEFSLKETINDLVFKISLPSFFQVNLSSAKILYEIAIKMADLEENTVLLDAYCGIGTMSLLAAKSCKKVIGIECVNDAIINAQENAFLNKIHNAEFICAKLEERIDLFNEVDVAIVNPPRQGLSQKVVEAINQHGPKKLIYVSCNPQTLSRDTKLLSNYRLKKVQPVDMFPQTVHVETVSIFIR